jgi:5-methyltetrahydrofolate--homocysteine methyltransferase
MAFLTKVIPWFIISKCKKRSVKSNMSDVLKTLAEKLYAGKFREMPELTRQALAGGLKPEQILQDGLIAGMDAVGRDFKAGELFVPEVLVAAKAMHAAMDVLRPLLVEGDVPTLGKYVIGTVQGDLHDIGKNLVGMMLEGAGFEVIDLGTDVTVQAFVEAVKTRRPHLMGMSALLTTTMPGMRATIDALREAGLRDQVKVMVGGAPVTAGFAREIGADGYAPDAAAAVDVARSLVS